VVRDKGVRGEGVPRELFCKDMSNGKNLELLIWGGGEGVVPRELFCLRKHVPTRESM